MQVERHLSTDTGMIVTFEKHKSIQWGHFANKISWKLWQTTIDPYGPWYKPVV